MRLPERQIYDELLRCARGAVHRADEAEDLLQAVLLAAIEAGRADMSTAEDRRWVKGALRKRAAFDARTAVRRRRRETAHPVGPVASESPTDTRAFVETLSPSLKATAQLALSGHTKAEIRWLLRVSDAALRQRIAQIRKRWRRIRGTQVVGLPGLGGGLQFGRVRKACLPPVQRDTRTLASHDPDGHLLAIRSQNPQSRQPHGTPSHQE